MFETLSDLIMELITWTVCWYHFIGALKCWFPWLLSRQCLLSSGHNKHEWFPHPNEVLRYLVILKVQDNMTRYLFICTISLIAMEMNYSLGIGFLWVDGSAETQWVLCYHCGTWYMYLLYLIAHNTDLLALKSLLSFSNIVNLNGRLLCILVGYRMKHKLFNPLNTRKLMIINGKENLFESKNIWIGTKGILDNTKIVFF